MAAEQKPLRIAGYRMLLAVSGSPDDEEKLRKLCDNIKEMGSNWALDFSGLDFWSIDILPEIEPITVLFEDTEEMEFVRIEDATGKLISE